MYVKTRVKAVFLTVRMKINNIYVFYRDDNGGFIKGTILRVRTCCIDEIALAFNALTKCGPTLSASERHHIEFVMCYNSKNLKIKRILWNIVLLISISKKHLCNPFFFVKLDGIDSYKPSKYCWNRMQISLFIYLFSKLCIFKSKFKDVFIIDL